jgi:hypothetical protein
MSTTISAVDRERKIEHGVLIDLTLIDPATDLPITYYISNCYKEIDYNGNTYQALAGFLTIGEIQNNISNANDELQIGLSAIPATYIAAVLGTPIKGGEVNIYRVFFDYNTQEVITGQVYKRFAGVISNYNVQEDIETLNQDVGVTHTITITASSVMGVLENKVSGRRTNKQDYQIVWPELANSATDPSMDRVDTLFNQSFDFGKPYTGKAANSVDGGNSGGPGQDVYDSSMYGPPG